MTTPQQSLDQIKLLVLVNKSYGEWDIEKARVGVTSQFSSDFGANAQVTDSAAWYKVHFPRAGSWESWIQTTVHGKEYATRKPYFDGYVVCSTYLGKANAQIVRGALDSQKVVLMWKEGDPFMLVSGLNAVNPNNWQSGWTVSTSPLG